MELDAPWVHLIKMCVPFLSDKMYASRFNLHHDILVENNLRMLFPKCLPNISEFHTLGFDQGQFLLGTFLPILLLNLLSFEPLVYPRLIKPSQLNRKQQR